MNSKERKQKKTKRMREKKRDSGRQNLKWINKHGCSDSTLHTYISFYCERLGSVVVFINRVETEDRIFFRKLNWITSHSPSQFNLHTNKLYMIYAFNCFAKCETNMQSRWKLPERNGENGDDCHCNCIKNDGYMHAKILRLNPKHTKK